MADKQSYKIEEWGAGEPITAEKLNRVVRAFNNGTTGINPPKQISGAASNGTQTKVEVQQLQIETIYGDYLICNPYDGVTADLNSHIAVARPGLLSTSQTSRNGLTFVYSDDQSRIATKTSDSSTESQVVVPSYVVGDIIFAVRNIIGGTSTLYGLDSDPVEWQDTNVDARAWAKVSS